MEPSSIKANYQSFVKINQITDLIKHTGHNIALKGLKGSSVSFVLATVFAKTKQNFFVTTDNKESAAYLYNDLQTIVGSQNVEFLPTSYQRSIQYGKADNTNILLRAEVLTKLAHAPNPFIVVTYPEAIMEKVIDPGQLQSNTFAVRKGDMLNMDFFIELLTEYEFERTDFVFEPGQFAVRGSIIDVFSFASEEPFRVDFFGNQVDSIRVFDIETQLTKCQPDELVIIPNIQDKLSDKPHIPITQFVNPGTVFWFYDFNFTIARIAQIYDNAPKIIEIKENGNELKLNDIVVDADMFGQLFDNKQIIEWGLGLTPQNYSEVVFNTTVQPTLKKNFKLLATTLQDNSTNNYSNFILFGSAEQSDRLKAIFKDQEAVVKFTPVMNTINEGFIDHDLKICCFTDHQIFERYHKFNIKTGFTKKESITLAELTNLHPGDYVVHIDHGIGQFGGLQKVEINGKKQETIKLIYRDNDVLFVSIHSLHRISKYKGKDADAPPVHKLGSAVWQNLKDKTKSKVKDIAKDLIKLYAERKAMQGFAFSPDSFMNQQLEASFFYEDTPDQLKATKAVKYDMESQTPMDRLVCGDVGFGKTEIAIRAAFKAVADNKQVAVLVPTTILALQHYKTFSDRLADFPVTVSYLSRLRKASETKQVVNDLKNGGIDIVIGTHRLVGADVKFKDLGLLIIDEEQKFGVSVKEKLKQIKSNVDTLTLTATPIPRTLQFSLMGARDLSIINTPPPNRQPINTEVHTFNEQIIQEAVNYELNRDGQVFFIHNRVQNIAEIAELVKKLCPKARVQFAHGQMDGGQLEKIMLEFIEGNFDVLVATTIIESGLDIPNANTIIINQAQNYGLSDLHQLRGRVGRSNKKAFCYLLAPPPVSLTNEARRRLKAIEDFSELGSGFNISLQDLDIRGAGNLLGAEQSGFIGDLGFEAYQKILDEAILELKQNELKDYFDQHNTENNTNNSQNEHVEQQGINFVSDCNVDTDMELLLPEKYISNTAERINMYRRLDGIKDPETLENFKLQLIDRFGDIPPQTTELLEVVKLRWLAMQMGIERLVLKNNKMTAYFIQNSESYFYKSQVFQKILHNIQKMAGSCHMQEKNNKLTLTFSNIQSIESALKKLNQTGN